MKTAILGGGIAGLAAVWYLRRAGHDVTLFEAGPHFGGKIISRHIDGCLLEGGPDSLLTEKPWGIDLCKDLGLENELLPSNDAQRSFSILHKGRLHPFPAGCKLFIPQKISPILFTPLLSLPAKLRMLMEPLLRHTPPAGDESLADFTRRHFGQAALERLAGPLLGGIYGGDPEDMSMDATFPRLRELERKHGSLVRGMALMMQQAAAQRRQGHAPSLFTSLRSGMQALPDALVASLGDTLRPNHRVRHLEKSGDGWSVDGEAYDALVIALPSRDAAPLFAQISPELQAQLQQQDASSSATLSLVFDRAELRDIPKGFGFMASHPLPSLLVGCTWTGNKFPGREASDRFVCRLFLGGPDNRDFLLQGSEEVVCDSALDALRTVCPFIPAHPVARWLQRWPHGNPSYRLGHLDWVARLNETGHTLGNLHFCGSGYGGVSVSDCIRQAQHLADTDMGHNTESNDGTNKRSAGKYRRT
jgi:oxygen-dependent protoporphyrinogen oxidase